DLLESCIEREVSRRPGDFTQVLAQLNALGKASSPAPLPPARPEPVLQPTGLTRETLLGILRKHFGSMSNPYLSPSIPARKVENTRTQYAAYLKPDDDILLVYDGTLWGGAKEGFIITDSGVGYKFDIGGNAGFKMFAAINPNEIRGEQSF